jgi:hypothetical protein
MEGAREGIMRDTGHLFRKDQLSVGGEESSS